VNRFTVPLLGVPLWGMVCWFWVPHDARRIQADLFTRSSAALRGAGLGDAGLVVDGRDAVLIGDAGTPESLAALQRVVGLRSVRIQIAARPPQNEETRRLNEDLERILKAESVGFRSESAYLTRPGKQTLDEVALALAQAPGVTVEISGHTDARGDAQQNLLLSERRARAVQHYLVSKGIPASRMVCAGYGQSRPIADNATRAGRLANRRIEFHVLEVR